MQIVIDIDEEELKQILLRGARPKEKCDLDKLIEDVRFCPDWKFTRSGVIDIIKECMEGNNDE